MNTYDRMASIPIDIMVKLVHNAFFFRMNYGVFLDEYSSILALDRLLEKGEVGNLEYLKYI